MTVWYARLIQCLNFFFVGRLFGRSVDDQGGFSLCNLRNVIMKEWR